MDTINVNRDAAIRKIVNMPKEQVLKVLIFMAGMEAEAWAQDNCRPEQAGVG